MLLEQMQICIEILFAKIYRIISFLKIYASIKRPTCLNGHLSLTIPLWTSCQRGSYLQPPPFPFEINNLLDIVGCLILQYFTIEFCVIKINSFKTVDQKPSHPITWRFLLSRTCTTSGGFS